MILLSGAAQAAIACIFAIAAYSKIRAPLSFATSLKDLGLGAAVPRKRAWLPGIALGCTEACMALALALNIAEETIELLTGLVLLFFTALIATRLLKGNTAPCGCFGRQKRLDQSTLARNGAFLTLVPLAAASSTDHSHFGDWLGHAQVAAPAVAVLAYILWLQYASINRFRVHGFGHGSLVSGQLPYRADMVGKQGSTRSTASTSKDDGALPRMIAELVNLEREVARTHCELVKSLEAEYANAPDDVQALAQVERDNESAFDSAEHAIDGRLSSLYSDLARYSTTEQNSNLSRVAAVHWAVTFRRTLNDCMHTRVPGLERDRDCIGDLVADSLLLEYVKTLFQNNGADEGRDGRIATVQSLANIARQTVCIGGRQSARAASALVSSYNYVASSLRFARLDHVLPSLAQAASNPLLLFYDVERFRGLDSPLARWFAENHTSLSEGARTGRSPAQWMALWLYDRRTGRMVGYGAGDGRRADENTVDLGAFWRSITSSTNMGDMSCSFSEMIERGALTDGYACLGSGCSERQSEVKAARWPTTNHLFRRVAHGAKADGAFAHLSDDNCKEGRAGGDGGGSGNGGAGGCRNAKSFGGRTRLKATIECVTSAIVSPSKTQMKCMLEATGYCSDPVGGGVKVQGWTPLPGIKANPKCAKSASNTEDEEKKKKEKAEKEKKEKEEQEKKEKEEQEKKDAAAKKAEEDHQRAKAEADAKAKAAAEARFEADTKKDEYEGKAFVLEAIGSMLPPPLEAIAMIHAKDALAEDKANAEAADALADALAIEAAVLEERRLHAYDRMVEAQEAAWTKIPKKKKKGGGEERPCPPDMLDCGNDDCSGMADAARRVSECLEQSFEKPAGRGGDGVTDPSPLDDESAGAWTKCLSFTSVMPNLEKNCWAAHCPASEVTQLAPTGRCECGKKPALGARVLQGHCGNVDCPDGMPVLHLGHCHCSPVGDVVARDRLKKVPVTVGGDLLPIRHRVLLDLMSGMDDL
jgi:hypothetical protein